MKLINKLDDLFHKYIYLLGEKIRNPLIQKKYNELLKSDFYSLEELQNIQERRLKDLLQHAKEYSAYYKNRLDSLNIDTFTLNDLVKIPFLSKKNLYDNVDKILNNPNNEKLIKSETSGSTGDALIFYRSQEWDAYHRAAQYRGYSWHDVNPWEKNIYFWGFNPSLKERMKIRILDFLVNRYRIFSFDSNVLDVASKKLERCSYVEGYSSAVFELSVHMKKRGYQFENVKMVKGTSEKIYDYYHKPVKDVFGKRMTSEYGAAETGIIAFECPHGSMHIAMENVIVEVIDSKIYVTNLHSHVFPIIRYELGDYVLMEDHVCSCGRSSPIIKEVTGRIGNKILGAQGEYPTLTLYYIFKNIALGKKVELAYFASQYKKGELNIEVMTENIDRNLVRKWIEEESSKYFGEDMTVLIEFIASKDRKNKKIKDFESYI